MKRMKDTLDYCKNKENNDSLKPAFATTKAGFLEKIPEKPKKEKLLDADIREPLFEFLEVTYGKTRIIEEKTMGKSRADVVMIVPNALYGIEIKSDADSYTRLASQVKDYDKYYDYNLVVVGSSHALHVKEHVPEYWGIISVENIGGDFDFYCLREPGKNPKVKIKQKLRILWKPELATLQEWNEMPKYKKMSKDFVIQKILERMELPEGKKGRIVPEVLDEQISELLFERDYNTVKETLSEYRKGELQKKLEAEANPEKRLAIMAEQAARGKNFENVTRKRRYRRRKRRTKTE